MTLNSSKFFVDSNWIKHSQEYNKQQFLEQIIDTNSIKLTFNLRDSISDDDKLVVKKLLRTSNKEQLENLSDVFDQEFFDYKIGNAFFEYLLSIDLFDKKLNEICNLLFPISASLHIQNLLYNHNEINLFTKKKLFDLIFTTLVKLKPEHIKDNISYSKILWYAETTDDVELHEFLFNPLGTRQDFLETYSYNYGDKLVNENIKGYISYYILNKLVNYLFDSSTRYKIFELLFTDNVSFENFFIKSPKLIFGNDGITLDKITSLHNSRVGKLNDPIVDFSIDSCGTVFALVNQTNETKVFRISENQSTPIITVKSCIKIEVNDSYLFLLKHINFIYEIEIYSKNTRQLISSFSIDKFNQKETNPKITKIEDISVNKDGNLIVLTNKGISKIISSENPYVELFPKIISSENPYVELFPKTLNLITNSSGPNFLATGKSNANIYILFNSNILLVYNQNIKFLRKLELEKSNVIGFDVYDGNDYTISRIKDNLIIVENIKNGIETIINSIESDVRFSNNFSPILFSQINIDKWFVATNLIKKTDDDTEEQIHEIIKWTSEKLTYETQAEFILGPFDSSEIDTRWHKIQNTVILPNKEKTHFSVSTFSTNDFLSHDEVENKVNNWNDLLSDPFDSLIDNKGQFLWIKFNLSSSDGTLSPVFKNSTLHFPRNSLLQYLPTIYQENTESKEFLDQFLSIFEKFFDDVDHHIFSLQKLFDPHATDDTFLSWLASWLALYYDKRWPKKQLRNLLANAHKLYKLRGTSVGLFYWIMFYLDPNYEIPKKSLQDDAFSINNDGNKPNILIFENFQINHIKDENYLRDYSQLYGQDPFSFVILLNPAVINDESLSVIRNIIETEKPAHTIGEVCLLRPMFILNSHTYLGINSDIHTQKFTIGKAILGQSLLKK